MRRRGVSILEVLFAIGVMGIGLLGVTAVLPVALSQVSKGLIKDRAARLGTNSVETFQTSMMANPNNWVWYDSTNNTLKSVGSPAITGNAYLIDPLLFARYYSRLNPTPSSSAAVFPFGTPITFPRMWRVGITKAAGLGLITGAHADQIFIANDDLVFGKPEEKTLPPNQEFGDGYRRQMEGSFSWFATVAPKYVASGSFSEFKSLYILSVVVFHKRDASYQLINANERMVGVTFNGGGFGGGEVTFQAASIDDVLVKPGSWVLLMADTSVAGSTDMFRWYRVADTGADTVANGPNFDLEVTLDGPDWPAAALASNSPAIPTYATVVANVVGVYEREIRLEDSSLWSGN